jgi:hypothetical protein
VNEHRHTHTHIRVLHVPLLKRFRAVHPHENCLKTTPFLFSMTTYSTTPMQFSSIMLDRYTNGRLRIVMPSRGSSIGMLSSTAVLGEAQCVCMCVCVCSRRWWRQCTACIRTVIHTLHCTLNHYTIHTHTLRSHYTLHHTARRTFALSSRKMRSGYGSTGALCSPSRGRAAPARQRLVGLWLGGGV